MSVTKTVTGISEDDIDKYKIKIKLNQYKEDSSSGTTTETLNKTIEHDISFDGAAMNENGEYVKTLVIDGKDEMTLPDIEDGISYRYTIQEEVYYNDILINDSSALASDKRNDIKTGTATGFIYGQPDKPGIKITRKQNGTSSTLLDSSNSGSAGYQSENELSIDQNITLNVELKNDYVPDKMYLYVTKQVKGNMSSEDKEFEFNVKYINSDSAENAEDTAYENSENYLSSDKDSDTGVKYDSSGNEITAAAGTSHLSFKSSEDGASFKLKHGEKIRLAVPYGVKVEVTETSANDGYKTVYTMDEETGQTDGKTCTIDNYTKEETIHFINTRNSSAPTGINSRTNAYRMLVVTALLCMISGALLTFNRKRRRYRGRE